jgi:hypothetical protein
MALSKDSLKSKIITNLEAAGFVVDGEFSRAAEYAGAIAKAVVDEIQQNAEVTTTTETGTVT